MLLCEGLVGLTTKSVWVSLMTKPEKGKKIVHLLVPFSPSFRILRVLSVKLRIEGDFNFAALAKATPGYVGADLSALTAAAGIIAVKRIFKQLSEGTLQLPTEPDSSMQVDEPQIATQASSSSLQPAPVIKAIATSSLSFPTSSPHSIAHFLNAHPDPLTPIQLAPLCITSADFTVALTQVQPSSKREGFATVPDVSWSDIGALHRTRDELHMAIVQPIKRPELFSAVGIEAACGVLLWGPPGCGKTLLAKAVANESRANFISVKGPELLNKVASSFSSDYPKLTPFLSMLVKAREQYAKSFREPGHHLLVSSSLMSLMHSSLGVMTVL